MEEFAKTSSAPKTPSVTESASEATAETPPVAESVSGTPPEAENISERPSETENAPGTRSEADAPPTTEAVTETASVTESASDSVSGTPPEAENAPETRSEADAPPTTEVVTGTPPASENIPTTTPASDSASQTPPGHAAPRPAYARAKRLRRQRRRRWLFGFVCGVALAGVLAFGAKIWEQRRAVSFNDRFVWDFRANAEETDSKDLSVKIPAWPFGEGAAFAIEREHGEAQTAQEVYRNVNPTVVTVIVELSDETAAVGTGVIFSADGYFLTNYHVIQGGVQCRAMLDSGRSYPALFVAGDERDDLAVLKMDASGPFPSAQFGDSERLSVGDTVYAIGNPLGIEFRGTLTNGLISAIDRDVLVDGRTMTLLQTNAALNSGNSGGPLINEYGQVIGINVVKMSSRRSTVEGLGFAIPSASMERLVNDLLTYGESQPEPVIGVSVDSFGTEVEPDLWGIRVLTVEPDSPAEAAGIQVDDYIIAADTETVSGSRDLLRVRRRYHMGESMSLTLWRDGERLDVSVAFTE